MRTQMTTVVSDRCVSKMFLALNGSPHHEPELIVLNEDQSKLHIVEVPRLTNWYVTNSCNWSPDYHIKSVYSTNGNSFHLNIKDKVTN